jgi:hypothetical protein
VLDGVRDRDTKASLLPSELFQETVILAERVADAGLTRDAAFPMMKNRAKSVVRRRSLVVRQPLEQSGVLNSPTTNDEQPTTVFHAHSVS